MKKITIARLAEVIGAALPKDMDGSAVVKRVLTQPEYVTPGDAVISAGWYSPERVIRESLERGAVVVFADRETKKKFPQTKVVAMDAPLEGVQRFERWCGDRCKAKRIVITGSVGKTTTTGLINTVIANSFNTLTGHSMSNSHGAILRNVQRLEPAHEWWVQEVGGVQPGYIESSACVLCPDVVVLTNIGESHLNTYFSKENILQDKGSLERYAKPDGVVVISYDDEMLRNAPFTHKVITCSLKDSSADYYARDIQTTREGINFTAVCREGEFAVRLGLYGEYNVYNALFAIAVGRYAGVPMKRVIELVGQYRPSSMRQNFINVGGYSLMIDAFNAEPKTVLGSAETLTQIPISETGRRIFITGHIDKLGSHSAEMHEALGHQLSKLDIDRIILFAGDSSYTYRALIEDGCKNACLMGSREELDQWMRENITRDDVVFFKSGQFEAALVKSVDHVFGTVFQNEQQYNEGTVVKKDGYWIRLRKDNIAEIEGYDGDETDLKLPEDYEGIPVIRIRPYAFLKNRRITSVTIPDTVVNIGDEAFYICVNLASVRLPNQLKIIGKNTFNYCKKLKNITIPSGTIHMDRHAFYDCSALESIYIPETVGFIGTDAFSSSAGPANKMLVISCKKDSYADQYAKENKLTTQYVE